MNYDAVAMQPGISQRNDVLVPVQVSYRGLEEPTDNGWEVRADLFKDRDVVIQEMGSFCITTSFITIRAAEFEFFIGDDEWNPPGGTFDPQILVQPGTFSNIENGYGFFGAGYSFEFAIRLSSSRLSQIGYAIERPCPSDAGLDPSEPVCQDIIPCFE